MLDVALSSEPWECTMVFNDNPNEIFFPTGPQIVVFPLFKTKLSLVVIIFSRKKKKGGGGFCKFLFYSSEELVWRFSFLLYQKKLYIWIAS